MTQKSRDRNRFLSLASLAGRYPLSATLIYIGLVSVFFLWFPGVDLAVSALFWSPDGGFDAETSPSLVRLRYLGPHLVRIVVISAILVLLLKLVFPLRKPLINLQIPVFLLSTLILAPGLIVNLVLKNHWGRPRPRMVENFGGDAPYVPVWEISDYCASNCSFVSGEASSSFWLVALAFLVPPAYRLAVALPTLLLALALSVNRVAFGGHFLSDTLLSWGITLLVILLMHRLIFRHPPAFLTEEALDSGLGRAGLGLRRQLTRLYGKIRRSLSAIAGAPR